MDKVGNVSKAEMVLLAAYERWPDSEFTAEELVIACWQSFPDSFGLQGFSEKYPDSNIVYRHIMGKDSIVKKQRWLSQKSQKRYALTPAGLNHALKIAGGVDLMTALQHQRIDRFYEQLLLRIFTGSAWKKFKNGQVEELTFTDACGFWSINPRSSSEQLRSARHDIASAISAIREHLGKGDREVMLAAKIKVSGEDLKQLQMLGRELETRFRDQLDLISHRSVKWGKVT